VAVWLLVVLGAAILVAGVLGRHRLALALLAAWIAVVAVA
jgi:hypothetical protein